MVLAGIESTVSFSSRCNNGVLKSASVINSSSIASGSVLSITSGGNDLMRSIQKLAVPGFVADLMT